MKRLLALFLSIIFICTFTSCNKNDVQEYTDNYLYTQIDGVLYKISPISATVTPVCPDPLCSHSNGSCPFYGVETIDFVGQYIYYIKSEKALSRYDLINSEFEVLYTPESGTLADLYAYEDFVFLNVGTLNTDFGYEYRLWRYDIDDDEAICLTDEPYEDRYICIAVEDERVYWSDDGYYSTDINYKNRKDNDRGYSDNLTMGDYHYIYEFLGYTVGEAGFKQPAVRLERVHNETGETTTVIDEVGFVPIMYGEKVIYAKNDAPRYIGEIIEDRGGEYEQQEAFYDRFGGKYYICDADGSNERLLCDFDGTGYVIRMGMPMLGGKNGVGEWTAVKAYNYSEPDENGIVELIGDVYIIININTGEWKVAEVETNS